MVRLETELTGERGLDLTLVAARAANIFRQYELREASIENLPGEQNTTELSLDEELGVEDRGSRVERETSLLRVDVIGRSDSVAIGERVNRH